ncbi:carboxypeptidase regulatory-like domain-containing protein [Granulicella cerasi]|uniref:Carboxypeptidase regulatory-like domain-containing protein n=1 Tax=Granulicella cerasi TaxID=741063 RepID=A0ABW1ZFE1_9BACT|nr:carboxypeptidase regulatory-like domain-containing protein [Granulicella cerasi]
MRRSLWATVFFALILTISPALFAQTTNGSIYGVVTDPTGAAVAHASVVVTDVHTNVKQTRETSSKGEYLFPTIFPGDYAVEVQAPGFKTQTQTGVTVQANSNIHVPVALTVGGASDTVSIEAGVTLVDTREAQVASTIEREDIEYLPSVDRNAYSLLATVPGVSNLGTDGVTGTRGGATLSVNGLPTDQTSFYLDGAYDTNFYGPGGNKAPNPDALEQFHVITSNFDAEFGRTPGAVVNMITKRGTNKFHGSVYEYWRSDQVNARGFFNTSGQSALLRQNQYGASLGGPVFKDKFFFFASYQHLTLHQNATQNSQQTLTAAERTGDFTNDNRTPAGFTVPAAYQCAANPNPKIICSDKLDPVALALLKFVPVFNNGTPQELASGNINNDEGLGRIDWDGFQNHKISGMYFRTQGLTLDPSAGGNGGLGIPGVLPQYSGMRELENQQNAVVSDDWTLSTRAVNSIRFFYTANRYIITNELGNDNFSSSLGSGLAQGSDTTSPTQYAVTGYFTLGPSGAGPSDINQIAFGAIDTATLQLGRHAVKVGGAWISAKYSEDGKGNSNGNFTFNGSGATNFALANFMMGSATTLVQNNGVHHRYRNQDPALFAQDDWQVTRRLNLNLGVRWELVQPWLGEHDQSTFVAGVQSVVNANAPLGLLVNGDAGVPDGAFKTAWNRFAPRLGFAYDLNGDGRTSVRGAFGMFYSQIEMSTISGQTQEPYAIAQQTNGVTSLQCPYGGTYSGGSCVGSSSPFPYKYSAGNAKYYSNTTLSAFRPGEKSTPYAEEWNLQVQQQLSKSTALTIGYVGMNYMKQYIQLDINTPKFYPGADVNENIFKQTAALPIGDNGLNCRRPYQPYRVGGPTNTTGSCTFNRATAGGFSDAQGYPLQFGAINEYFPANNSHYNSLQAQLTGHLRSFDFNSNIVWGKVLNFTTPTVDQSDIRKNYGPADVDVRLRYAFSGTYRTPDVHLWGQFGKQVLSGWRLSDISIFQSGSSFTLQANVDVNRDGNTNDRVNISGDPYKHYRSHYDMVYKGYMYGGPIVSQPCGAATTDVNCSPYGQEKRNTMRNPNDWRSNISANKEFALPKSVKFQLRAEAFNVFNYTHLTSVRNNLTVYPTAVNAFQSADAGRVLQFAGKFLF